MSSHFLITGGAGFIGSHLCERLLKMGHKVTCIDNFDDFYPKEIKKSNTAVCLSYDAFKMIEQDISNIHLLEDVLTDNYDGIIHLAAKAGILPSILNSIEYSQVNIIGTQHMLEFARTKGIKKFIFASSSSTYGINNSCPWKEDETTLMPISPYASSKISGEILGKVYAHLYGIQFLALRFFTVFGPRQRPDLAIHKFVNSIQNDIPINLFGNGMTQRDYTFIDDIIDGIVSSLNYSETQYEVFNLGNNIPISLSDLINAIEVVLSKKAIINHLPMQPGDVPITYASIDKAKRLLNYGPKVNLTEGLQKFYNWYLHGKQSSI